MSCSLQSCCRFWFSTSSQPSLVSGFLSLVCRTLGKRCPACLVWSLGMVLGYFWEVAQVPRLLCFVAPSPFQAPLGQVLGWLLFAELPWIPACSALGSWLKARPGIATHYDRHHPQAHLFAMSLNVAKCNLG